VATGRMRWSLFRCRTCRFGTESMVRHPPHDGKPGRRTKNSARHVAFRPLMEEAEGAGQARGRDLYSFDQNWRSDPAAPSGPGLCRSTHALHSAYHEITSPWTCDRKHGSFEYKLSLAPPSSMNRKGTPFRAYVGGAAPRSHQRTGVKDERTSAWRARPAWQLGDLQASRSWIRYLRDRIWGRFAGKTYRGSKLVRYRDARGASTLAELG
jgi:hypothetical protein